MMMFEQKWDTNPDFEGFNGPHKPEPTHECMIEGWHVHITGKYDSFWRLDDLAKMAEEEQPQLALVYEDAPFDNFECPICELFGNDKYSLRQVERGIYQCNALQPHVISHNELSNWWARKHKSEQGAEDVIVKPVNQVEGNVVVDHEWIAMVTTHLVEKNLHTAVLEIWKEIHNV